MFVLAKAKLPSYALIKFIKDLRSFHARRTRENNLDPMTGKYYELEVGFRDFNFKNQKPDNLVVLSKIDRKEFLARRFK